MQALILGFYDKGKMTCCGRVRTGFTQLHRMRLAPLLRPLQTDERPFANVSMFTKKELAEIRWLKPEVVVQVAFVNWTPSGLLRHAEYKGLREDKLPKDVRRE